MESTYIVPCYPLYPALAYALIYLAHPASLLTLPTHVCLLRAVTSLARWTCTAGPLHPDSCDAGTAKADAEAKYIVRDPLARFLRHTVSFRGLGRLLARHFHGAAASVSVLLETVSWLG